MKTKIIAHRGDKKKFPENTMLSFIKAVDKGADAIELDIQHTKDKKIIIHHDYYLGNSDNGKGLLLNKNSNYLLSLDCGSWFSSKFDGEKMPLLEDVFKKFGKNINYEIELKGFSKEFIVDVLRLVEKFYLLKNIEFTSPHVYILSKLKDLNPRVKTGFFVDKFPDWMDVDLGLMITRNNLSLGNIDVVHIPWNIINKSTVKIFHKHNLKVHASNCNSTESIDLALKSGVDQLSTDELDLAIELQKRYDTNHRKNRSK